VITEVRNAGKLLISTKDRERNPYKRTIGGNHMSNGPIIQYVGFKVTHLVREYTFSVREAAGVREFILNITNAAFVSRRARYQDAPAICALRLSAELAAHSNHPQESHFAITASELDSYRQSHGPKPTGSPYGRKHQDHF
jgi:hypothetical protein